MKKLILVGLSFLFIFHAQAGGDDLLGINNTTQKSKSASPLDVPGSLMLDFGFNFLLDAPDDMKPRVWGSRIVNIYYMYNIQFGKSHFSISPGIGVGLEKYSFVEDISLVYNPDLDPETSANTFITPLDTLYPRASDFVKSQLATEYFDIPLELRFYTGKNPNKGFKIAAGGKIGILFASRTKVKYKEDGINKKTKQKERFDLNTFRYGVYGRIGYDWVSLFYYHGLSNLFKNGKGPELTEATNFNLGITISGF